MAKTKELRRIDIMAAKVALALGMKKISKVGKAHVVVGSRLGSEGEKFQARTIALKWENGN